MLGSFDFSQKRAVVVGGGISGLLLTYQLAKADFEVQLVEKSQRLGGLIQTLHTEHGISESAVHSFLLSPPVEALLNELGVSWLPIQKGSRARYIFRNGQLRRMPLRALEILGAAKRFFFAKSPESPLQNLAQWGEHFLGRSAARYLLSPALLGVYGARLSELSVQAVLPMFSNRPGETLFRLLRSVKKQGSSQKKRMVTLPDGMESLVRALENALLKFPKVSVKFSTEFRVKDYLNTPNTALCVPAFEASRILAETDPQTSQALAQIEYAPLWSCTVFLNKKDFKQVPKGVGVLFPEEEKKEILGILFNSSSFSGRVPTGNLVSITCILGGTLHPELMHKDDSYIENRVSLLLEEVFGVTAKPYKIVHHRWPKAIPLYNQQMINTWSVCKKGWCSNLGNILFGNYVGTLSVRGMIESSSLVQSKNIKSV